MLMKPYYVLFFLPDDMNIRIAEYESDFPPPSYQPGDLFDARYVDPVNLGDHGSYFRVISVEHQVLPVLGNENHAARFSIGVHLEELSKEDYFLAAVRRRPSGAE